MEIVVINRHSIYKCSGLEMEINMSMELKTLRKSDTASLKCMVKALTLFNGFFNDTEDNQRLEFAKQVLKERRSNHV